MVKIIVGLMGSSVASGSTRLATVASVQQYLDTCRKHNVKELDTARVYNAGKSEELLGQADNAGFLIETKAPGFSAGSLKYESIMSNANASLAAIQRPFMDLYYFHGPDRDTPLEDSCRAIGQLHKEGKIKSFGVSNLSPSEVEEVIQICARNDWPKPSVYQGGYNPLGRGAEKGLFPLLRKHGMTFYAFSPLGGSFFTRSTEELRAPASPGSRLDQMPVFKEMYVTDNTLSFHERLSAACAAQGTTLKAATLRWIMHHSILGDEDGVILGASSSEQLEENLEACEQGPLSQDVVQLFEDMWQKHSEGKVWPFHS